MNTILVATDSSAFANNALKYAAAMAAGKGMNLHLFTSYELVVSSSYDVAFSSPSSLDLENGIK